jgi:hypothetical protein
MSCFWGHKWSRWREYEQHYSAYDTRAAKMVGDATETRQKRICARCGMTDDRYMHKGPMGPAASAT